MLLNDCGFAADEILNMIIISGKADLFGTGDPALVTGMSGEELASFPYTGKRTDQRNPAFVIPGGKGRQKNTGAAGSCISAMGNRMVFQMDLQVVVRQRKFWLCIRFFHEASEQKASSVLRNRIENARKQTQLQRMRLYAGMTQAALAQKAEVSLPARFSRTNSGGKILTRHRQKPFSGSVAVLGCGKRIYWSANKEIKRPSQVPASFKKGDQVTCLNVKKRSFSFLGRSCRDPFM